MRTKVGILLGLAFLGAACSRSPREQSANREDRRMAFVRLVNAMPGGPAIDIFAGDQKVFADIKSGAVVPYREVSTGFTTFRARWTGRETAPAISHKPSCWRTASKNSRLFRRSTRSAASYRTFPWFADCMPSETRVRTPCCGPARRDPGITLRR